MDRYQANAKRIMEALTGTRLWFREPHGSGFQQVEVDTVSINAHETTFEFEVPYRGRLVKRIQNSRLPDARNGEWVIAFKDGSVLREKKPTGLSGLGHMAVQVHAQGPLDRNRYQASVLKPSSKRHKNQTGEDVVLMADGGFATPQEAHLWLSTWASQHAEATDFIIYDRKAGRMVYAHTTRRGHGRAIPRGSFQGLGCASCGGMAGLGGDSITYSRWPGFTSRVTLREDGRYNWALIWGRDTVVGSGTANGPADADRQMQAKHYVVATMESPNRPSPKKGRGMAGLGDIGKATDNVAEEGSVSHGTMLPGDLIPAFLSMLKHLDPDRAKSIEEEYEDVIRDPDGADADVENDLLERLFDILDEYSPNGCYFGAHEGDGSDYGYWVSDVPEYYADGRPAPRRYD